MITIHKYHLQPGESNHVLYMPMHARILTAQNQRGMLMLWAQVDDHWPPQKRYIEVHGTGNDIDIIKAGRRVYISTAQVGESVWHVFERVNAEL